MSTYSDNRPGLADDVCEVTCTNRKKVASVARRMEKENAIQDLADLFKALGDPTRLLILHALSFEELCVCDIAALLDRSQSAISHQLRILRMARLVKHRKEGKMVHYSLDDEHVRSLLEQGLRHAKE